MSQTHISNLKKKPSSVCTMATSHALKDLKIFIYSLRLFEETIPIYILCDTETQKGLERFKNDDNISEKKCITLLRQFIKVHNYNCVGREKSINGKKTMTYRLIYSNEDYLSSPINYDT